MGAQEDLAEGTFPLDPNETLDLPKKDISFEETGIEIEIEPTEKPRGFRIGRYEVIRRVGKGGMGEVFMCSKTDTFVKGETLIEKVLKEAKESIKFSEAVENKLKDIETRILEKQRVGDLGANLLMKEEEIPAIVAVKYIETRDPEARKRFRNEAKTTYSLRKSNNIVNIYEYVEEDDRAYYSMEFLPEAMPINNVSERKGLEMILQIAEGLSYAHQFKITHRDLKPENVRIRKLIQGEKETSQCVLIDWGIAKDVRDTDITQEGTVMGTPLYMSPEQARGEEMDAQTDIYALGSIAHRLFTGKFIEYGIALLSEEEGSFRDQNHVRSYVNTLSTRQLQATKFPSEHKDMNKRLEAITLKLTAKDKEERYEECSEVIQDITDYIFGNKVEAESYRSKLVRRKWWDKRKKQVVKAGAAAAVVTALGLGSIFYSNMQGKGRLNDLNQNFASITQNITEIEKVSELLELEERLGKGLQLTEKALGDYKGKSYEDDFSNLKKNILEEQQELEGIILNSAIEELRLVDATSERAEELFKIANRRLHSHKTTHLSRTVPKGKIPRSIDESGKWNFSDHSKDAQVGYYPAILLQGYLATDNNELMDGFKSLTKMLESNRKTTNSSTSEFYDNFLTDYQNYRLNGDTKSLEHFLKESQRLVKRFRGESRYREENQGFGDFIQSSKSIEDGNTSLNNVLSLMYVGDVLSSAYQETGELVYWDVLEKHMNTSLELLLNEQGVNKQGLAYANFLQAAYVIQKNNYVSESLGRTLNQGDVVKIYVQELENPEEGFSSTGQAAAIKGFLGYYKLSGDLKFLQAARKGAEFMLSNINGNNTWNRIIGENKTDSPISTNATALMAHNYLDLSVLATERRQIYERIAKQALKTLATEFLDTSLDYQGFVRNSQSIALQTKDTSDVHTDFLFLSALNKLNGSNRSETRTIGREKIKLPGFVHAGSGKLAIDNRTLVSTWHDQDKLYFNFKCFYDGSINNTQYGGEQIRGNDFVEITIDVLEDERSFYTFILTPQGFKRDGIGSYDTSWYPSWNLESNIESEFWTAQAAIPFEEIEGIKDNEFELNIYRVSNTRDKDVYTSLGHTEKYFRNIDSKFESASDYSVKNMKIKIKD
jgi:serine/threonine protein kinase